MEVLRSLSNTQSYETSNPAENFLQKSSARHTINQHLSTNLPVTFMNCAELGFL